MAVMYICFEMVPGGNIMISFISVGLSILMMLAVISSLNC